MKDEERKQIIKILESGEMLSSEWSSVLFPNQRREREPVFEELDIVKIVTDAYEEEGLKKGEEGTVVLVHKEEDGSAYEVEFGNWTKSFPIKVKTLESDEIVMAKKWRE